MYARTIGLTLEESDKLRTWIDATIAEVIKARGRNNTMDNIPYRLTIDAAEVTSIAVPEQWVCSPMLRRVAWCSTEKLQQLWTESWSGKQEWRDVPLVTEQLGTRADYESDVREAQAAYEANRSSMNHEDLIAAQSALRRHWPDARA